MTFNFTSSGFLGQRDMFSEGQSVMSREFTVPSPGGEETKWTFELVPKFNTDYVKVVIHSKNNFDVITKLHLTLVDQHGAKCLLNKGFNVPSFYSFIFKRHAQLDVWSLNWNTLRKTARYMPNGDLKLNLKLILYGEPKSFSKRLSNVQEPKDIQNDLQVFENLDEFYLSKELSDVLINC